MLEAAVGHRLEHHVDVAAVVEVAVAEDDGVERGQVDPPLRVLDDRAGTGIQREPGVPVLEEKAARRRDLLRDHEASAGRPHEGEVYVSATSLNATSDFSPK